jgi:hypothetical protein
MDQQKFLENGKYGMLVPVEEPQILADAVVKSLNLKTNTDVTISRALYFSIDNSVKKYLEIMKIKKD